MLLKAGLGIAGHLIAIVVTVLGAAGAICLPMDDITDFLYLIGSVFAPMIAIQIADFFIPKQTDDDCAFRVKNLIIWVVGFVAYRFLMQVDFALDNALPDMVLTVLLCLAASRFGAKKQAA